MCVPFSNELHWLLILTLWCLSLSHQVNDSLIKVLEESRSASAGAVTGDLLGLESPSRASMQRMSLI